MKLLPPFPSAPGGPKAIHEFKITRKGKVVLVELFAATYSAKKFVEALLRDDKPKWINPHVIALESIDLEIFCKELEDIVEYEYTKEEKAWQLPEPYPQNALRARGEKLSRKRLTSTDTGDSVNEPVKKRSALINQKKGPPRREVPKGMVTITQICTEIKLEPRVARAILRTKDVEKPELGWVFDKKGADSIKALLKKEMK